MEKDLEFSFKGNRKYVHGTDIYNKLIEILSNDITPRKFDLSFHGIAQNNIKLSSLKPKDNILLKFACKYVDKKEERRILYGIENEKKIESRYEYLEDSICQLSQLNLVNEEVILKNDSEFSFIENTVALNKYLLENLFPDVEGKWYFTRFQINEIPFGQYYPLKIVLKSNFNFKLTKSEIYIEDNFIGYIYFSLK